MKRALYLETLKYIKTEIKNCNTDLRVSYKKISFSSDGPKYGVRGHFDNHGVKPIIRVYIQGNTSYGERLFTLAHELRHAQHLQQGLFNDYYDNVYFDESHMRNLILGISTKIPDLDLCLAAENECNQFALNFLKDRGIILNPQTQAYRTIYDGYDEEQIYHYHFRDILYAKAGLWNLPRLHLDKLYNINQPK